MALALTPLVGSALLIRSFVAIRQVHPGFDTHRVLTMQTALIGRRFATAGPVAELVRSGVQRLNAVPGVDVAAGTLNGVPLEGGSYLNVSIVGRPRDDEYYAVGFYLVSPSYFDVLKVPLVRGRLFNDRDDESAPPVVLINQAMARRYWADADPLRDALVIAPKIGGEMEETVPRHIVGVVGDVRHRALRQDPRASIYVPIAQVSERQAAFFNRVGLLYMTWIVRTRGEPRLLADVIQHEIRTASGGLPVDRIRSMDDISAASTSRNELEMWVTTSFGAVAMLLAAVGLYGVMSYSLQQRRREIGIRMALGAESRELRRMILAQAMKMTAIGVIVGIVCALGLTRLMAGLLFGIGQYDLTSFVAVPLVLSAVALAATWLPARSASSVDPMIALRAE